MKKFLSTMAVFGLGVNAVAGTTATSKISFKNTTNQQQMGVDTFSIAGEEKLDWSEIETNLHFELENLNNKEQKLFSVNEETGEPLPEEVIEKVKQNSLEFLEEVKNLATGWEVMNRLFELSPDLKASYKEEMLKAIEGETSNLNTFSNPKIETFAPENEGEFRISKQHFKELRIVIKSSVILAASSSIVAGILAGAYWANAWWFGLTIPAAIAATTTSVLLATYSIFAESIFLKTETPFESLSKSIDNWDLNDILTIIGTWDILVGLSVIMLNYTLGASAAISVVAWASPTAWGVSALLLTIISLIQVIKD